MRGGEFQPEPLQDRDPTVADILNQPTLEQVEAALRPDETRWLPKALLVEQDLLLPPERGLTLRGRLKIEEDNLVVLEKDELHGRYPDQIGSGLADGYQEIAREVARALRDEVKFLKESQSRYGMYQVFETLAQSRVFQHTLANQWVAAAYRDLVALRQSLGVIVPKGVVPIDLEDIQDS